MYSYNLPCFCSCVENHSELVVKGTEREDNSSQKGRHDQIHGRRSTGRTHEEKEINHSVINMYLNGEVCFIFNCHDLHYIPFLVINPVSLHILPTFSVFFSNYLNVSVYFLM